MGQSKKVIYIILGTIFLILGGIGVFVPLLPTTPFWLLTCWFYIRSSQRMYDWAMRNRFFGSYMKAYLIDKAIPKRSKIISLTIMWVSILFTVFFVINIILVKIMLILISIGVSVHILSFPTRKE